MLPPVLVGPALALAVALVGCGTDPALPMPSSTAPAAARSPRTVHRLEEVARYHRLAVPVAFTRDGTHWIGAVDHDLVVYDGEREVQRMAVSVGGTDPALAPLPDGGWIAGARVLAADGTPRFDGWSLAQRYGRFGSPKASAISPDGAVAILDGADSPSTCLCDRDRGTGGSSAGALVRLTLDREQPVERVLVEHSGYMGYQLAASTTAVAALAGHELSIWPARGDAAPVTATIDLTELQSLAWVSDGYLLVTRFVALDHTDVILLDRDAGWQPARTWPVPGMIRDLKVRPGGTDVAIAWTNYLATDRVLVDERRVEVYAVDGARRASVDTAGWPSSVAWSPSGDALLVAMVGNEEREQAVVRFAVR